MGRDRYRCFSGRTGFRVSPAVEPEALAQLLAQAPSSPAPQWVQVARESGQAFQAWVTPVLLVVGGLWAFFRFRRGRTFRRRLKVEVEGRIERATGIEGPEPLLYLALTVVVTNIGDAAVEVDADLLTVEALEVPVDKPPWDAEWGNIWGDLDVELGLRKFEGGRVLEPGEPAEEQRLLGLPDTGYGALRVQAKVGSTKAGKSWDNAQVVVVDRRVDNGRTKTAEREEGCGTT
jgi:hypothetical protein